MPPELFAITPPTVAMSVLAGSGPARGRAAQARRSRRRAPCPAARAQVGRPPPPSRPRQWRRTSTRMPSPCAWPLRLVPPAAEGDRHAGAARVGHHLGDVVRIVRHHHRLRESAGTGWRRRRSAPGRRRAPGPGRRPAAPRAPSAAARACRRRARRAPGRARARPPAERAAMTSGRTAPRSRRPYERHAGLDRDLDQLGRAGGDRLCQRRAQLVARHRRAARASRNRSPSRRCRAPARPGPGAPISPSNSANHFRIAYSSLRSTSTVSGTS